MTEQDNLVRRLADYERLSAVFWLVCGIVQILCIVTALAGIWNVFVAISRFKLVPRIMARDEQVPAEFEALAGYVVIGILNLIFGAVIGLVFLAFDLFVRDQVLSHRDVFGGSAPLRGGHPAFRTGDLEVLERLAMLRDKGILTDGEFQIQKARILGLCG
jgi:ABC-type uncharacterized transport system permease subunit